ncbi:MAG: RNA polymerase sigma factor [Planctomycetales bacterium]|nr:RNA polymerase sigma factor [Planctomycetales bacterium]
MSTTIAKTRRKKQNVNQPTDEQLLLEYKQTGNRDLFAKLVSRYEHELFNYLHRYTGSAEMAEDAFQAAFLQIHLKCEQFEEGRRFRPWMYAIATNQAIDGQRRNKRHRIASLDQINSRHDDESGSLMDMLVSPEASPFDVVDSRENQEWIRNQLADLPDHLRSVIGLVYFEGLKYREAADVLDIPVGTVKSRLHAAVLKLNEAWQSNQIQRN